MNINLARNPSILSILSIDVTSYIKLQNNDLYKYNCLPTFKNENYRFQCPLENKLLWKSYKPEFDTPETANLADLPPQIISDSKKQKINIDDQQSQNIEIKSIGLFNIDTNRWYTIVTLLK